MLSGKYLGGARPEGSRWTLLQSITRDTPQANAAVARYIEIANDHGLEPAQMALAFVNSRPFVTANIIGATSLEQLKSNIASVDIELSDGVLREIEGVYRDFPIPY